MRKFGSNGYPRIETPPFGFGCVLVLAAICIAGVAIGGCALKARWERSNLGPPVPVMPRAVATNTVPTWGSDLSDEEIATAWDKIEASTRESLKTEAEPSEYRTATEIFPERILPYQFQMWHKGEWGIALFFRIDPAQIEDRIFDVFVCGVPRETTDNRVIAYPSQEDAEAKTKGEDITIPGWEVMDRHCYDLDGRDLSREEDGPVAFSDSDERKAFIRQPGWSSPYYLRILLAAQAKQFTADEIEKQVADWRMGEISLVVSKFPRGRGPGPRD